MWNYFYKTLSIVASMEEILIVIGAVSIIAFIWATIMIYAFLKERSKKIESFVFIDLFVFRYINRYKAITKKETGKTGYLFYIWIISVNLALLCFLIFLIKKY